MPIALYDGITFYFNANSVFVGRDEIVEVYAGEMLIWPTTAYPSFGLRDTQADDARITMAGDFREVMGGSGLEADDRVTMTGDARTTQAGDNRTTQGV